MHVAGQSAAWPGNCSSHRAAKCQEDEHDIHGPHLTSQASKRDTRVSSAAGTVPKQSLPRPAHCPSQTAVGDCPRPGLPTRSCQASECSLCPSTAAPRAFDWDSRVLPTTHPAGLSRHWSIATGGGVDRLLTDPGRGAHATFCVYIPPGPPGDSGQDQTDKGRTQSSTVRATSNPGGT